MTAYFDDFLDLLKELIRQPAVVGAEHAFMQTLKRELHETGLRNVNKNGSDQPLTLEPSKSPIKVAQYEGLLVAQGSEPDSVYISVHVDRHGLICTGPNEFQYAAYVAKNKGELTGNSISEQTFKLISGRFHNEPIQAYEPWSGIYLGTGSIQSAYVCERRGNLVFNVTGLEHVHPGTPVGYLDRLTIHDGWLAAQLDNVLTVAILMFLFRCGYQGTAFFTAEEEAGRSWRYLLEWFRREGKSTDRLLVLDTSPFPDKAATAAQDVVLRRRDEHQVFNPRVVAELEAVCENRGFRCEYKDSYIAKLNVDRVMEGKGQSSLGSTELGRIAKESNREIWGATLQVPTTGYHTPREMASIKSVKAVLQVLMDLTIHGECRFSGNIDDPNEHLRGKG